MRGRENMSIVTIERGRESSHCHIVFTLVVLVIPVVEPSMGVRTSVRGREGVSIITVEREGGRGHTS